MDTESVAVDPRRHTDGESGAIGGLTPLERVDRITALAQGLDGLAKLFDSALNAKDEHLSTPLVWAKALYLVGIIANDIHHENSALWEQVRPALQFARTQQES